MTFNFNCTSNTLTPQENVSRKKGHKSLAQDNYRARDENKLALMKLSPTWYRRGACAGDEMKL